MNRLSGKLNENFELKIKEEPDYAFQKDSKDDSNLNISRYRPPSESGRFSSKSLSGLGKNLKKRVKFDSKRRKQLSNESSPENNNYLKIFERKSFRNLIFLQNKKFVNYKASYYENMTHSESEDPKTENDYVYPTNIINQFFFHWTIKLFRLAQKVGQLKVLSLGIFSKELTADQFLKEILPVWEKISNNKKSNPLLKTIIRASLCNLIFIFFMCFLVSFLDIMTIIFYRQVLLLFESNKKDFNNETYFPLLSSIVILLSNKLVHIFLLRFFQFYSLKFGTKITIQINTLIYDKLLKISPHASISEGNIVNFIQLDAEKIGDFFSYVPSTVVLPLKIFFFVYLLFKYFGLTFILGLIALIMILFFSIYSQGKRAYYQKELLKYKDQRMKATTQALNSMKIIKINSWEKYFYEKIKSQREIELEYLKKMQILTLFINALSLSTSNITSLISILAHSFLSSEISISNILTSLYIFNSLGDPIFLFPEYISGLLDLMISLKRLETFLFSKENNRNQIIKNSDNDTKYAIYIDGLDFGIIKDEVIEEENEKIEDKKSLKENEEKEFDDSPIDLNFKRSRNRKKTQVLKKSPLLIPKYLETYSDKGLPKIFKRKKIFSSSKRLSSIISSINQSNKSNLSDNKNVNNISRFKSNDDEDNLNIEKEKEEIEKEREKDKSSIMISLNEEEDSQSLVDSSRDNSVPVEIKVTIPLLSNITLKVENGDLIGIIGETGSGKTCLLNSILNNLDILNFSENSKIIVNGSIAYVPQIPWIVNDTVKGNIIFHKEYDDDRYQHIVNICDLQKDFISLTGGEFTEIGEKGVNLSTGQKIRISIARAIYSNSDIYLFDDPLSALDPSMRNNIFHNVIKSYLKSKTVLIATHALQYIPLMKHVIHMKNGRIDFMGTAKEAMSQDFYKEYINTEKNEDEIDDNIDDIKNENNNNDTQFKNSILNELNDTDFENNNKINLFNNINIKQKKKSLTLSSSNTKKEDSNSNKDSNLPNFHSLKLIIDYSGGIFVIILLMLINIIWKTCESGSDYILMLWSTELRETRRKNNVYFAIYACMSINSILFIFFRTLSTVGSILKFNKNMHDSLLKKLLKAPLNLFHDIIPKSHVLHRLSKDLDNSIRFFWSVNLGSRLLFELLSCLIISFLFNAFCVIPYPLMLFMEYRIFLFYIKGGRALNFLETITRSPIITNFTETLNGICSIRCFEYQENFRKKYHQRLDDFYKVLIYQNGTSGWFALNLDLICFFLLFFILAFSWIFEKLVNPIVLGLLIGYTIKMIENTYGFFDQYITFEKMYSSMDNCEAYTHIVQESSSKLKNDKFLKENHFPKKGEIKFINYWVKYRPDTEFVLKNINLTIKPGEKIGVVGRTGSGKTTLCLGLFRILEATKGQILIDGVDISKIGLELLRDNISLIPQDPKLIGTSLRENIDPLGKYSDDEISHLFNLMGLAYLLDEHGKLDVEIEADENMSIGEKQLICIARAMLKKSKIIIMDEANSSFDYKTDMLIQKSLMGSFEGCTLITIAHKIKTVMGHDRIIVLEDGELVESGKPEELIAKKKGLFYELYKQSQI